VDRNEAVTYAMSVLRTADDWQEAQHALANHSTVGPWLNEYFGDYVVSGVQSIIREAEEKLGVNLPY
jgi:hypothetical protein